MQDIETAVKASIDFPKEGELVTSPHYSFRIEAPLNAEKVEICIDGSPWQLCRYASGRWWYDWSGYQSGEHEVVVRTLPFDSRNYLLSTRRFSVSLNRGSQSFNQQGNYEQQNAYDHHGNDGQKQTVTQYSVLTNNEPWMLARVTQLLSKEDINITGVLSVNIGDTAAIQFLTDRNQGLRQKLENAGLPVLEKEVFHLAIPNQPEELNRLVRTLAERDINIRSLYGAVEHNRVKLVIAVDQPEKAAPIIAQFALNAQSSN